MTISATQDAPVFSTPPLEREPAVAPAEASEPTYPPRELPYIFCEWSESIVFQDKTAYSLSEFDRLMKQADDEYVTKKAAAMAKYGTWQKWYDADDPEYNAFLGYDKVKFTLVMPDGRTFTERQDIGDGDGGVLDFLSQYDAYREIVPTLQEAVRKEAEAAQSAPAPQPGPDSGRFWDAYNSIKERNPDSLLLYQVGDFFELYGGVEGDDAWNAAKALDLTLTKRNIPEYGRVSMCGFPARKLEDYYARSLAAPDRSLTVIRKQLHGLLTPSTRRQLETVSSAVSLFRQGRSDLVFYTAENGCGGTMLCATISDLTAQLRQTLWRQERPAVLTSATLAVGEDFRRFKEETGLLTDSRVTESVALSPFNYQQNCLLYLPQFPPRQKAAAYYDELAKEIAALLKTAQGHALALFTSYAAMSAVKERLTAHGLRYPLFTMGRSAIHTTEQFKANPGSVLLAAGAAWEGFDFPGDCVSLLIIPRLPFAVPDALKEKERENHPSLRLFIRAVVVPEMQIKLKQGFGRAIRTETDTCVVAILDERAAKGRRYCKDVLAALPEMPVTCSLEDVARFIRTVKSDTYFMEAAS